LSSSAAAKNLFSAAAQVLTAQSCHPAEETTEKLALMRYDSIKGVKCFHLWAHISNSHRLKQHIFVWVCCL